MWFHDQIDGVEIMLARAKMPKHSSKNTFKMDVIFFSEMRRKIKTHAEFPLNLWWFVHPSGLFCCRRVSFGAVSIGETALLQSSFNSQVIWGSSGNARQLQIVQRPWPRGSKDVSGVASTFIQVSVRYLFFLHYLPPSGCLFSDYLTVLSLLMGTITSHNSIQVCWQQHDFYHLGDGTEVDQKQLWAGWGITLPCQYALS